MQSFKQFLIENDDNEITFVINFKFEDKKQSRNNRLDTDFKLKDKREIIKKMSELGCENIKEVFFGDESTFPNIIAILKQSYNESELKLLIEKYINCLQDILQFKLTFSTSNCIIVVRQLNNPNMTFTWPNVYINPEKQTSLKNLHKIFNVDSIYIHNPQYITDSVLSILKFRRFFIVDKHDEIEWPIILRKYLDNRDILACQDELIENGLKEYAKL